MGFCKLMKFEVSRARQHYVVSEELFGQIDPPGRPVLRAMFARLRWAAGSDQTGRLRRFWTHDPLAAWRKALIGVAAVLGRASGRTARAVLGKFDQVGLGRKKVESPPVPRGVVKCAQPWTPLIKLTRSIPSAAGRYASG
ncbi:MAG: hypothetical protein CM1200mP2_08040 [Planctomycetaceae bacterium]|nr:MAG: hypothetical protein CM1200mP2_08040 [Planctomycetaceae bacterium]